MRRTLMGISMLAFFGLAGVGWCSGCAPLTCAVKAATGAAILYVVLTVAWRIVVSIVVSALIESSGTKQEGAVVSERRSQPHE